MKKIILCASAFVSMYHVQAQTKLTKMPPPAPLPAARIISPAFKNATDSFSYAAGMSVAESMRQAGADKLNTALFAKAMNDVYSKSKTAFTKEAANMTLQNKLQEFAKKRSDMQKAEGLNFLAANKKKSGVISLPNGLQYEVIKAGDPAGMKPKVVDTVVVNYIGTLTNGTEFDNSVKRGQPATFPLNGVIRGWTEILQLMPKGANWKVFIPSELAYGENPPQGTQIPPSSVLVFEITLLDIKPAGPAQTK